MTLNSDTPQSPDSGKPSQPMGPSGSSDDMAALSDEQLVEQYRKGRSEAFEELVERYRQELFHFLVRFAGNHAGADDLFQEAFIQVHLSIDTFDITRRFKPWLFTIAANKARDSLRRNRRRQMAPLSALVDQNQDDGRSYMDLMEADLPLPTDVAEQEEMGQLVREMVQSLPEHLREVLLMAYFHRFAYQEIADMLQVPLGTVKSRLHSAVGTFAQLWKQRHKELR